MLRYMLAFMTETEGLLTSLCSRHSSVLESSYKQLRSTDVWDLSSSVVLIDNRRTDSQATIVPVGGLSNVVPVSTTIDNELLKGWIELSSKVGAEEAMNQYLDEHGEAWAEAYQAFADERESRGSMLMGTDDLTAFISRSKDTYPDDLAVLVMMVTNQENEWTLVQFSWRPES